MRTLSFWSKTSSDILAEYTVLRYAVRAFTGSFVRTTSQVPGGTTPGSALTVRTNPVGGTAARFAGPVPMQLLRPATVTIVKPATRNLMKSPSCCSLQLTSHCVEPGITFAGSLLRSAVLGGRVRAASPRNSLEIRASISRYCRHCCVRKHRYDDCCSLRAR